MLDKSKGRARLGPPLLFLPVVSPLIQFLELWVHLELLWFDFKLRLKHFVVLLQLLKDFWCTAYGAAFAKAFAFPAFFTGAVPALATFFQATIHAWWLGCCLRLGATCTAIFQSIALPAIGAFASPAFTGFV